MKRRSSSSSSRLARCPSDEAVAAWRSSRLSHQSSATPSYGSGPPRLACSTPLSGSSRVCTWTYRRMRSVAAWRRTSGPCSSRQLRWKSARESWGRRRRQNTSFTMASSEASVELVEAPPVDVVAERRLPPLLQHARAEREGVHLGAHEAEVGVLRGAHDRLAADVEARVDEHGTAGQRLEAAEQRVIERV